jgi:hypothetical protein
MGNPLFVNAGRNVEDFGTGVSTSASASACTGNYQLIRQAMVGFWDNIYKDAFRRVAADCNIPSPRYGFGGVGG